MRTIQSSNFSRPRNLTKPVIFITRYSRSLETVLNCPICMIMMPPPILQCRNGHSLCEQCHKKISQCGICRVALNQAAPIRTLTMDLFIEVHGVRYPCINEERGCREKLPWGAKKIQHEATCAYARVQCPCKSLCLVGSANCSSMLTIDEIMDHCINKHAAKNINGSTVRYTFQRDTPNGNWAPQIFNKKLIIFAFIEKGVVTAYARHFSGKPIRYRLTISGNGFELSFSGPSEAIDQKPRFEYEDSRLLCISQKLFARLTNGFAETSFLVKIQILD